MVRQAIHLLSPSLGTLDKGAAHVLLLAENPPPVSGGDSFVPKACYQYTSTRLQGSGKRSRRSFRYPHACFEDVTIAEHDHLSINKADALLVALSDFGSLLKVAISIRFALERIHNLCLFAIVLNFYLIHDRSLQPLNPKYQLPV